MLTFFALASSFSLLVENQVNFSCSSGDWTGLTGCDYVIVDSVSTDKQAKRNKM